MHSLFVAYADLAMAGSEFKEKALAWADRFPLAACYEPNTGNTAYPYGGFDNLLAVSSNTTNLVNPEQAFDSLQAIWPGGNQILCGILSYDLKNQVEELSSQNPDQVGFPLMFFFQPEHHLVFQEDGATIYSSQTDPVSIRQAILAENTPIQLEINEINVHQKVSQDQYLQTVNNIREEILNGEIYEMNFCMEFYAEVNHLSPVAVFLALNSLSPMPFGAFFKMQDKYLVCASPERFLRKQGALLVSQPIKGTIRRGASPEEDARLRHQLSQDQKERAENMMIMDLVRNDLGRSSLTGTVQVEEMFGIYGFRQVFQMMTTVTGQIRPDCHPVTVIKNAFPMGSMTGAPKIRAMELIDQYESTRRGLFSGSIGYLKPNGDFDFNVVIRSLQYNAATGYLSFMVGSAITYDSVPEQEYQECLLKARAILSVLSASL